MSLKGGQKRLFEASEAINNSDRLKQNRRRSLEVENSDCPLVGLVICLTGLPSEKKSHLHALVQRLGGRFTRDFNLDENTHLVAETKGGAKYELASSHPRKVHIVLPSWLDACARTGTRVPEADHDLSRASLQKANGRDEDNMLHNIQVLLDRHSTARTLFNFHQFLLLGFEEDTELKKALGKLIRRGMGTISWELNDQVSILILHDTCHDALRKAASTILQHHVNIPSAVSPRWVLESWRENLPLPTSQYPPMKAKVEIAPPIKTEPTAKTSSLVRYDSTTSSIFRGSIFMLARIAPPSGAVDFDSKEQEAIIRRNGGQILTLKLMDAMRVDVRNGRQRRRCFVVSWGGRPQLELNPILSQLKRHNICELKPVTPLWLLTCVSVQKLVPPERLPFALIPKGAFQYIRNKNLVVRASLTGFQSTAKEALIHLMKACGIEVHHEMTRTTSHLICKETATGLKLKKALEWGIKIVHVKWLYHVLEFGYAGKTASEGGCESQFSVSIPETQLN